MLLLESSLWVLWQVAAVKDILKLTGIYTQTLVYVTHIAGHFTDHSAWWQAGKQSLLFKTSASHVPCALFQCIALNVSFLLTVFNKHAKKGLVQCIEHSIRFSVTTFKKMCW